MKIVEWIQNKLNGSNGKRKPSSISVISNYKLHDPGKQEFSDWPQALLAIGTFGNSNSKEHLGNKTNTTAEDSSSFQDCVQKVFLEEVGNLQNELNIYFRAEVESNLAEEQEKRPNDLINKGLDCDHSALELEDKEKDNETFSDGSNINFYPSGSLVYSRGKDLCFDSSKSVVDKRSLFFLLKKMFVCRSGFQPTPLFKDPLSTESRMEKILRAILHKKIYSQGSCSPTLMKKYLEARRMPQSDNDDDDDDEEELTSGAGNGNKWVKTDDEYIVLEI